MVEQVLAIAALNDRIATVRQLLSEDERNVTLTEARRKGGDGTLVEVLSAQGQLAEDRANMPSFEQQLVEGRAMLAVLLGISPAELGPTPFTLRQFTLPARVPSPCLRRWFTSGLTFLKPKQGCMPPLPQSAWRRPSSIPT